MGLVGRLQQVESELIRYKVLKGQSEEAAQIAIRLLVEDEYTLPDAQLEVVKALVVYAALETNDSEMAEALESYRSCLLLEAQQFAGSHNCRDDFESELSTANMSISSPTRKLKLSAAGGSSSFFILEAKREYVTMEVF